MRNSTLMARNAVQINSYEKNDSDGKRCCANKFSQWETELYGKQCCTDKHQPITNGTLLASDIAQIIHPIRNSTLRASDVVQINKRCCADQISLRQKAR
jgi:hypothetical protein